MDQQTKQAVTVAMDHALTTVAFEEFHQLAYDSSSKTANRVVYALSSLDRLYKGGLPNYDEWDALLYHWYQPSQINLAYSMISSITIPDRLHIVDYGCGALAMQFAVALAALDALALSQSIPEVNITSIDPSQPKVDMGNRIWNQFKLEVRKEASLKYVSHACENIEVHTNPSIFEFVSSSGWSLSRGAQCWLSALHASYKDNQDLQTDDIRSFVSTLSPDACFATTHSSKGNLLQELWNFMNDCGYYLPMFSLVPQFSGGLPEITQWRKNLKSSLQMNHSFLDGGVTWNRNVTRKQGKTEFDAAFRVYYKKPPDFDVYRGDDMTTEPAQPMLFDTGSTLQPPPPLPSRIGETAVKYRTVREVLTRATGFMNAYDFTLNPYSGCSFGCTYCYAAFFSRTKQGRDTWGKWVDVKENAVELMNRRRLGSLDGKLIYISSVTDPYQPVERELNLTRRVLEIMAERHKPKLVVQTRSPDVVRDVDLFRQIEASGGRVQVNMTVTTDDEDVRRTFEPFCPSNMVRLHAIGEVQSAGVETCITMTPLLLVNQPYAFVNSLLETGVEKFIAQPFHFSRGKFVASTREGAFDLMAEKLGCERSSFQDTYLEHYQRVFEVLRDKLPDLGEGKEGFKPPF